jgi:hypothetical protein
MKQLAARDYEDLLQVSSSGDFSNSVNSWLIYFTQCSIAAFEGLLPEPHNKRLMQLFFVFAHWHGLVKLWLHTDHTISILDDLTTTLGQQLRDFVKNTCEKISTKELRREYDARKRRNMKKTGGKTAPGAKSKGKQATRQRKEESEGETLPTDSDTGRSSRDLYGRFCAQDSKAEPICIFRRRASREDAKPQHAEAPCPRARRRQYQTIWYYRLLLESHRASPLLYHPSCTRFSSMTP